jgi:hypothetical protein
MSVISPYSDPLLAVLFIFEIAFIHFIGTTSELTSIELNGFSHSALESITIPRHVQILCAACFLACISLSSISRHCQIPCSEHFLYCESVAWIALGIHSDLIGIKSKVCYCPSLKSVTTRVDVQSLGLECPVHCKSLLLISFETDSEWKCIKSIPFSGACLEGITIPRYIKILCSEY